MSPTQNIPSIFNDVLGPVMRGPSSSHSAAANRIGRLCRDLVDGDLRKAIIEYDPNGSLVTTHKSQGTDMGLYGGFLGWKPDDPRLPDYESHTNAVGLEIEVRYESYGASHPNNYKLTIEGLNGDSHSMQAISTGGGMIEIREIDRSPVSMGGDLYETLIYLKEDADSEAALGECSNIVGSEDGVYCPGEGATRFLRFSSTQAPVSDLLEELGEIDAVAFIRILAPVLPTLSRKDLSVPFQTVEAMLTFNEGKDLSLWELALEYESARGRGFERRGFRASSNDPSHHGRRGKDRIRGNAICGSNPSLPIGQSAGTRSPRSTYPRGC